MPTMKNQISKEDRERLCGSALELVTKLAESEVGVRNRKKVMAEFQEPNGAAYQLRETKLVLTTTPYLTIRGWILAYTLLREKGESKCSAG